MTDTFNTTPSPRKVGILLGIGILLLPIIFAWFTLRKGYSTVARIVSFVWLAVSLVIASQLGNATPAPTSPGDPVASTQPQAPRVDDRITMTKYSQLQTGMSYNEVVAILGKPGTELSSNEIAGTKTIMYSWDAGFGASMNAMFQNDAMMQKAQMGLRD